MIVTWDFLMNFDYTKPLNKKTRSQKTYNNYKKHISYLILNKIDINKYIYQKYLLDNDYCIRKNEFPYNVDDNIFHYILWINPNYEKKLTNKKILEIVISKMNKL